MVVWMVDVVEGEEVVELLSLYWAGRLRTLGVVTVLGVLCLPGCLVERACGLRGEVVVVETLLTYLVERYTLA